MDLLEIGAIAQVLGAVAILLSLIFVIIELRKNLKQNNIANTFQRAIEWEKILYKHCLLYTSPSPRDKRQSRMPSSA